MYRLIHTLHHFHLDLSCCESKWMKRSFLWRWRYLTANNEVKMYGIKHWIKAQKHTTDLAIKLIFHSQMNGDENRLKVETCSELMDWSINCSGHLPKISEFARLMVST